MVDPDRFKLSSAVLETAVINFKYTKGLWQYNCH